MRSAAYRCAFSPKPTKDDPSRLHYSKQLYVKSPEEMAERFADLPEAMENTVRVAARCDVELDFSESHAPIVRVVRRDDEGAPLAYDGTGDVTEWVRGEHQLCVKYTHQYKNKRVNGAVLIPLDQVDNRKEKEAGLISGIQKIFKESELFFQIFKMEEEDSSFYNVFMSRYRPRLEAATGLKFDTPRQWFDWIQSNKDRLTLSSSGEHVVVR